MFLFLLGCLEAPVIVAPAASWVEVPCDDAFDVYLPEGALVMSVLGCVETHCTTGLLDAYSVSKHPAPVVSAWCEPRMDGTGATTVTVTWIEP